LHWDGPILFQSQRLEAYQSALNQLQKQDLIFPCICTRQDIQEQDGIYTGTCRQLSMEALAADRQPYAIRCRVDTRCIRYIDALQGDQAQELATELGDFIVKRKDGFFAYQLAVVVDDAFQGISHVVRGIDLLDSTARQIYLQHALKLPESTYAHIPVIVNNDGQKLSKQHHARPLDLQQPVHTIYSALCYLQQRPPKSLLKSSMKDLLDWAIAHWDMHKMANLRQIPEQTKKNYPSIIGDF
jgi:glutamyl-Q tRNA(Asp) synthetase